VRRPFLNIWLIAALVGVAAFTLLDVKHVAGASMEPAVRERETVIIYRWFYGVRLPFAREYCLRWRGVKAGDVILLRHPRTGEEIIKRCAAAEGTPYRVADTTLYIGAESYRLSYDARRELQQYQRVPKGKVFVVGDNTRVSHDSREYGFVSAEAIEGRVIHPSR
jgi:signal peptidase I